MGFEVVDFLVQKYSTNGTDHENKVHEVYNYLVWL